MTSYIEFSSTIAQESNYQESKYWQRAYGLFGGSIIRMLAKGHIFPEYFQSDYSIELHFELSEQIASWINENLLDAPESQLLREALRQSPDHGEDHFRRVGKWYKKAQGIDKMIRSDIGYQFFSPSAFISKYTHDLVETYSGQKEKHDGAAALLTLGYVLQSLSQANEALSDFSKGKYTEFPKDDWIKIAWGAAFICRYHSKPELMPSTEDLLEMQTKQNANGVNMGIVSCMELLRDAEYMLQEANVKRKEKGEPEFASIEEFFPPYGLIRTFIDEIRRGEIHAPQFDELEIEGLKKQTRLFAAADKLDSTYPADLSAVRTFLTRPDRQFFVRLPSDMSIEDELSERVRRGGGHESPCDFDRFLFEMTRTKTFEGVSIAVQRWYANGLRRKGVFLKNGIVEMLEGHGETFLTAYEHLEKNMAITILEKAGYKMQDIQYILEISDEELQRKEIKKKLYIALYNVDLYTEVINRVLLEKNTVEEIIDKKLHQLSTLNLTLEEKVRIRTLLLRAQIVQNDGLRWIPGPANEDPTPYKGYISIRKYEGRN